MSGNTEAPNPGATENEKKPVKSILKNPSGQSSTDEKKATRKGDERPAEVNTGEDQETDDEWTPSEEGIRLMNKVQDAAQEKGTVTPPPKKPKPFKPKHPNFEVDDESENDQNDGDESAGHTLLGKRSQWGHQRHR